MRSFPLAEYEQRVPIRIGSLSQCFTAQHGSGEEVLLKQLLPAFARVPAIAASWLERAEQNSRLDHPGCSRVLDWGEALGESYLTLPLVAAASLRELLQAAAKAALWPQPEAVVAIAQGVLTALAHAQTQFGLPHLDIDPHAVLLRKDGSVLLTEFGMWRALPAESATRERFDRGRVAYLCPELTKSLEGDARSDVFSLGAILYELLGKERPFHGATQLVTAMAIAEGRRRPLRELAPHAPEVLCEIVETMLAQNPDERFQSAQAVLGALSSCCQADAGALAGWLGSLELRAGPQPGFARVPRRAPGPPATLQAGKAASRREEGLAAAPLLLGAASAAQESPCPPHAVSGTGSHVLQPPPLLSPPALVAGAAPAHDVCAPDDWLAPPPLLSPGRAPAALETQVRDAGAKVRDGRTAFLDTGHARDALARAGTAARTAEPLAPPRAANAAGAPVRSARMANAVTRDAPAVDGLGFPRHAPDDPASLAASKPLQGATPPPVAPAQPLLGASLPPTARAQSLGAMSPAALPVQSLPGAMAAPQLLLGAASPAAVPVQSLPGAMAAPQPLLGAASPAALPVQPLPGAMAAPQPLLGAASPAAAAAQPLSVALPPPPLLGPLSQAPAPLPAAFPQPLRGALSPAAGPVQPLPAALPAPAAYAQPACAALSPSGAHEKPLASALPALEYDAPHAGDRRGWREPSKTVFQLKAFAKHATRVRRTRAPLPVMVLLAVAFGFAAVAGGALLFRLIAS
jgi:hypothetical protein